VELDRVVPASGNLWIAGQQVWLGPAMTGRTVRIWAGTRQVHVLANGHRIKTLPSRLDATDLARLAAAGAMPAGPSPLPPPESSVIEIDRIVSASGNVSVGNHVLSAGSPLAGQRVTVRLTAPSPTSCPAASWPARSPAPSLTQPATGCAEPVPQPPSLPGCPISSPSKDGSRSAAPS
jgi:hypothetical protein